MHVFHSTATGSAERKREYFNLARFQENALDPLTKKPFGERARELPTANLGYFLAIIKEKLNDGFTLTSLDGHSFQNLISSNSATDYCELFLLGAKVYWYFISSVGQNCVYFLGAAKPKDRQIASPEQELFYKATHNDPKALLQLGNRFYQGSNLLPMNKCLALALINCDVVANDSRILYLRGLMRLKGELPTNTIQEALDDIIYAAFYPLPEALFTLGTFAETGQYSTQQSTVKAFGFYTRAAQLNYPEAFIKLGNYYAFGNTFNPMQPHPHVDQYTAVRYYSKAALLGNLEAMILTANMFEYGPYLPSSHDLAAKYLYMAARAGCEISGKRLASYEYFKDRKPSLLDPVEIGQTFLDPFDQYVPDGTKTLYFTLEELIKLDDRDIAYQSGIRLLKETGVEFFFEGMQIASQDSGSLVTDKLRAGLKFIFLACRLQHADANFILGHVALGGLSVHFPHTRAIDYFQASANLGSVSGIYALSQCYKTGIGVPISHETYLSYLRFAVDKGHPLATREIALALEISYKNALKLLEESKTAPNSDKKIQEALAILHRLAKTDNMARAQFTLGVFYFEGNFLNISNSTAKFLIRVSIANGFQPTNEERKKIELIRQSKSILFINEAPGGMPQEDSLFLRQEQGHFKQEKRSANTNLGQASTSSYFYQKKREHPVHDVLLDFSSEEGMITRAKRRKLQQK